MSTPATKHCVIGAEKNWRKPNVRLPEGRQSKDNDDEEREHEKKGHEVWKKLERFSESKRDKEAKEIVERLHNQLSQLEDGISDGSEDLAGTAEHKGLGFSQRHLRNISSGTNKENE